MIDRPIQFRTAMYLYTLLGIGMALLNHFVVFSTPAYNIFAQAAGG